ncbi:MAG TPA: hypothetical protein PKL51_16135, partial [Nitrospira sp.]|nr:hypothetical protein [Nitrospira sp.]
EAWKALWGLPYLAVVPRLARRSSETVPNGPSPTGISGDVALQATTSKQMRTSSQDFLRRIGSQAREIL